MISTKSKAWVLFPDLTWAATMIGRGGYIWIDSWWMSLLGWDDAVDWRDVPGLGRCYSPCLDGRHSSVEGREGIVDGSEQVHHLWLLLVGTD